MNRKKFTVLIIMMLLSIIGIIWVQIVWIRKAVAIRNESFNHAVIVSLNNAAHAIETSRKMDFYNNYILNDPLSYGESTLDISGFWSIGNVSSDPGNSVSVNITNQSYSGNSDTGLVTTMNKSYVFTGDTSYVSDSVTYYITASDELGKMNIVREAEAGNANSKSIYVRQNDFLNFVKKSSSAFQNMNDQLISEIYQWEKTLELDNNVIENALKQQLSYSGIQTPFEFAIIKDGKVQEGTFKKSSKSDFLKNNYRVRLFPDNIIRQDLLLSVFFPGRANYVLGSMALILGGSLIFSLFILATFGLSLFFIIRQKKVSEMKSDFINNMTHEFKTPIATISLAADTITNPKVITSESSIRHFINMIKKENSRMNKKVETILQIASLDKEEIDFRFENISIHTIIEHAVETLEIQIQQRDGKINLFMDATENIICGDKEHLTNLVNNLLDNAIKYSNDFPEITVSTGCSEKGVLLSFEDKGIGMTKAVQSKIFERFYRLSSGNVHDVKGFGLGLNYVRAIIDAHKGTIDVFSEPGKGSRFEIFLPFKCEN